MKLLLNLALILALAASSAFGQARSKRLILKDGSYQSATKWEVKGDRVRYYSAERYMWEELPTELVDWPATEKFEKDVVAGKVKAADDPDPADPSLDEPEPEPPTVAPGLQLPDVGGIFLLDRFKNEPRLVEVVQNGSEINQQRTKNILRSVINPIPSGPTQTVELRGAKASVQSHTLQPEFFVNVNFAVDDPAAKPELPPGTDRFRIVKLQAKPKDKVRVVSNLKMSLLGKVKEQRELVPTRSEKLTGDWMKVVPESPLQPGEYALVEMVSGEQMNIYVWDFGVDPKAPPNRQTWAPKKAETTQTGTNESPVLEKRKDR
jgi:hypothetical protein